LLNDGFSTLGLWYLILRVSGEVYSDEELDCWCCCCWSWSCRVLLEAQWVLSSCTISNSFSVGFSHIDPGETVIDAVFDEWLSAMEIWENDPFSPTSGLTPHGLLFGFGFFSLALRAAVFPGRFPALTDLNDVSMVPCSFDSVVVASFPVYSLRQQWHRRNKRLLVHYHLLCMLIALLCTFRCL
jgi:hypothetical protein